MDEEQEDKLAESMLFVKAPELVDALETARLDLPQGTNADKLILYLAKNFPHDFMKHVKDSISCPWSSAVQEYIIKGEKIQAIKQYREECGKPLIALKEAKEEVDRCEEYLRSQRKLKRF